MLQWVSGCIYSFRPCFSPDIYPGVGLKYYMGANNSDTRESKKYKTNMSTEGLSKPLQYLAGLTEGISLWKAISKTGECKGHSGRPRETWKIKEIRNYQNITVIFQ